MFLDMKPMRFKIVYTPIFFLLFLILPGCKTSSTAKLDFSDGSYEGQINKDGEKHGSGIYRWIDGSIYEGNYLNDLRHGHGRFLWANGESYEGDYLKDERTGKGTYSWPDGSFYKGEFLSGKRHGQGIYQSVDGTVYEGEWFDDLQHGQGTLSYPDGRVMSGVWRKGSLVPKPAVLPTPSEQPSLPIVILDQEGETETTSPSPAVQEKELTQGDKSLEPRKLNPGSLAVINEDNNTPTAIDLTGDPSDIQQEPVIPTPPTEPEEFIEEEKIVNQTVTIKEDIIEPDWTGTVAEAEAYFITELIDGFDTVRLRASGIKFSGRLRIVNSAGQAKGDVNLLNGRMHGEEIFYNDQGEVVEKNYWENGRPIGK